MIIYYTPGSKCTWITTFYLVFMKDSCSETDNDDVKVISYSSVSVVVCPYLKNTKIPDDLNSKAHANSCAVQSLIEEEDKAEIMGMLNAISVFDQIIPEEIAEKQWKDLILEIVCQPVTSGERLKPSSITKCKFRAVWKYLLQLNRLIIKKGVLHWLYMQNDGRLSQISLPCKVPSMGASTST